VVEDAAEGEALHLHGEEGLEDVGGVEMREGGEVGGGGGAEELEVALGEGEVGGVAGGYCRWWRRANLGGYSPFFLQGL
jgi:hypothetical protein